ncbi:hypothetical protein PSTT_14304 [Puccinia striiformis]|uniref:Retrotransposon gag domain-containing protein n=1 Tax=Puccinia striiformis TaxID=27350 RepID=A0A2S4UMR4_9BASI|nr:hypothetical protein PSTT_14304 [Puccinia striiformis]
MSRRRTVSTSNLLPLSDPEAIIRAANAACRHLTQPIQPSQRATMTDSPGGNNPTIPHLPDDGYRAWFRLVIKAQHAALVQSETDRRAARDAAEANATRIARLEDLVLALAVKSEEPPGDDELDLQNGLQIFFTTKNVNRASDKIEIIGGLIDDSNLLKFYANEASNYLTGSWEAFKTRMFQVALPLNWRMELRKQIHQITMSPTESFMDYSTRARTLQTLANFDVAAAAKIADSDLAQFILFGLSQDLQDRITEHQIMEKTPFEYSYFEQRVNCHFCKKTCGNAAGACPGPIDKKFIPIPDSFITPPKPPNYTPPRAWTNSQAQPGRSTHPPAGRPSARAATVAGVSEDEQGDMAALAAVQEELARDGLYFSHATDDLEGCYGRLDSASVAAYGDLDNQRWANEEEKYVHSPSKSPTTCHSPPLHQSSRKRLTAGRSKIPSTGTSAPKTSPGCRATTNDAANLEYPRQQFIASLTPPYAVPQPPGLPVHSPFLPPPLQIFPSFQHFPPYFFFYPPIFV